MGKKNSFPCTIFYELQPIDVDERDFSLHLRADDDRATKELKRWFHQNLYRKLYYYDRVAEYHTVKKNGKTYLEQLEKNPKFLMIRGIDEH